MKIQSTNKERNSQKKKSLLCRGTLKKTSPKNDFYQGTLTGTCQLWKICLQSVLPFLLQGDKKILHTK